MKVVKNDSVVYKLQKGDFCEIADVMGTCLVLSHERVLLNRNNWCVVFLYKVRSLTAGMDTEVF